MNTYTYIILGFQVLGLGYSINKGLSEFTAVAAQTAVILPLVGRVLNWW